jgi:hypothetical protein
VTAIPSKLSISTVLTTTPQGNAPSKWSTVITLNCGNTPAELRGLPASKNSRSLLFEHFAPPSSYKDGGRHGSEEQSRRSYGGAYRDDARHIGMSRNRRRHRAASGPTASGSFGDNRGAPIQRGDHGGVPDHVRAAAASLIDSCRSQSGLCCFSEKFGFR